MVHIVLAGAVASSKNAAVAAAPGAAGKHQQQTEQHSQPHGTRVTGYDTTCQRGVILAQQACLHRAEKVLTAFVGGLKRQLYQWMREEHLWQVAWAQMVEQLDTV